MSFLEEKTKFVVLPIGKIIIIQKNGVKGYLKVCANNTYENLTIEELNYINNIFDAPKSPIVYSEKAWNIATQNETFQIEGNEFWKIIIENVEAVIPENARSNFYKNLQTLQFEKVFDNQKANVPASYNTVENKIKISDNYMDRIKFGVIENSPLDIMHTIIHEMVHMASSNYDKETGIINIGFESFKDDGTRIDSNRGCTEGMAEVITDDILKRIFGNDVNALGSSGYKKEIQVVKQLRFLVDHNELYESYFNATGVDKIKDSLAKHISAREDSKQVIDDLFSGMEEIYDLKHFESNEDFKTNIPVVVQEALLDVFNQKIKNDIQNGIIKDVSFLVEYTGMIKKFLISSENIQNNSEKFEGLENIIKRFEQMQTRLAQEIALKNPEQNPDVPIYSPISGAILERSENGKFYSEHEDVEYTISEDGKLVRVEYENNNALAQDMHQDKLQHDDITDITSDAKSSDISRAYFDIKHDLAKENGHENNLKKEEMDYE